MRPPTSVDIGHLEDRKPQFGTSDPSKARVRGGSHDPISEFQPRDDSVQQIISSEVRHRFVQLRLHLLLLVQSYLRHLLASQTTNHESEVRV